MIAIHNGPIAADSSTRISSTNPAVVGFTPGISRSTEIAPATAPRAATTSRPSRGTLRRQYTKAFGGMAALVLLGAHAVKKS